MSIVQIGGQDFLLQSVDPFTIESTDRNGFVPLVLRPSTLIPRVVVNANSAEVRTLLLQADRLTVDFIPVYLKDFNDPVIRSSFYKYLKMPALGVFRPKPKPTTGYVYPRRLT